MRVIKYYDDQWDVGLLVKSGSKYVHVIPMDVGGIRVKKFSAEKETGFIFLDDYQLERAAERFLDAGRRFGMTKEAERYLREAVRTSRRAA